MDQARLQTKVAKGYAKAAQRLGALTTQYRPAARTAPMTTAHATLMADFASDAAFTFQKPPLWGKPTVYGLLDTTDVLAGDILAAPMGTYFVARFEPYRPVICILTDRIISFSATAQSGSGITGDGSAGTCSLAGYQDGYGGQTDDSGAVTVEASGWPASILRRGVGSKMDTGLPGALGQAQFDVLCPIIPGFVPKAYMQIEDDLGVSYTVDAAEVSQYGSRLIVSVNQI
ncbi:hypothetical protein [Acetobacter malorum]|uniref:hypothetical protein n=1 Tax=Acetobacter malorum TaxID=178901 RepID=UPI000A362C72|nr:hypothetical protein [Acetobacter malorum]